MATTILERVKGKSASSANGLPMTLEAASPDFAAAVAKATDIAGRIDAIRARREGLLSGRPSSLSARAAAWLRGEPADVLDDSRQAIQRVDEELAVAVEASRLHAVEVEKLKKQAGTLLMQAHQPAIDEIERKERDAFAAALELSRQKTEAALAVTTVSGIEHTALIHLYFQRFREPLSQTLKDVDSYLSSKEDAIMTVALATAYHEAGHCIAAWTFGAVVSYLTCVPRGRLAGEIRYDMDVLTVQQQLAVLHAGRFAEVFMTGIRPDDQSWSLDREKAERLLGTVPEQPRPLIRHDALRDASALVRNQWIAIQVVADELLAAGTMHQAALEGFRRRLFR